MFGIEEWLTGLPPLLVYLVVGGVILTESMGVPLPGEIILVTASIMAASGIINIWGVAIAATVGAIVGDSIGYAIGRRGGRALLERFGRRFPKHFGPTHLARAEAIFARWGVWAVFFGRFVALLRILAGPLAGALKVPYRKFLLANATGGIVWASGTAFVIYFAGRAAEEYLKDFSWIALIVAILFGVGTTVFLRRRAARAARLHEAGSEGEPLDEIAAVAVEVVEDSIAEATHPHDPDPDPASARPKIPVTGQIPADRRESDRS
jgi:membrane protein DedA with SNARE-associated domain